MQHQNTLQNITNFSGETGDIWSFI